MSLATTITNTNTAHYYGARTYINLIAIANAVRIGIIKITISMEIMFAITNTFTFTNMFTITNMATITIITIIIITIVKHKGALQCL